VRLDEVDTPTEFYIRGYIIEEYDWEDVIAVKAFHAMKNIGIFRWRHRILSKNHDYLGQFLAMRDWTRLRKISASYVDGIWAFLCIVGRPVVRY